jgi:hypothetical protein
MKLQSTNSTMVSVLWSRRIVESHDHHSGDGQECVGEFWLIRAKQERSHWNKEAAVFTTELLDIGGGSGLSKLCLVLHQSSSVRLHFLSF